MTDVLSPFRITRDGDAIKKLIQGTVTLNPSAISADAINTETFSAPGAETDMTVFVMPRQATAANPYSIVAARVSAANTIEVSLGNNGAATQTPGSQTWAYLAFK